MTDTRAALRDAIQGQIPDGQMLGDFVAAQFKRSYPDNYTAYHRACQDGDVVIGRMFVTRIDGDDAPRFIINFPTKQDRRSPSTLEYIEAGMEDLIRVIRENGITSIAVPGLGSGLGGLSWSDVRPRIEAAMERLPEVDVHLYEPLPD